MTRKTFSVALVLLCVCGLAASGRQQDSGVRVRIVEPVSGAFLSGDVMLKAAIVPDTAAPAVKELTFFVDGRQVCKLSVPPFECAWDAGPEVKARLIRVVATLVQGTREIASVRTSELGYADRVNVDAVQLPIVVTDADGRFVKGLTRDAFRVFEDDVPQRISSFASENVPLELVAAVDVSQSMTDAIPLMKVAARTFLSSLTTNDQVTVMAFNDNIFTLARRTTSSEARLRAVDRLAPWGGTALYDAVIKGVDTLGHQPGRRAIVIFTDGKDESSHATLEAATARVEGTDAAVYPVGLGRATELTGLRTLLERFAQISGGRSLFKSRPEELQEAFDEILRDLSNQYLLGYQPTNQKRDGELRRVRVEVAGDRYKVRHREGYRLVAPAP